LDVWKRGGSKMSENMTVRQWIKAFDRDEFSGNDYPTQIRAGWYDWFCRDESLRNKTYKLALKVKYFAKSSRIDIDKTYVFFKNNCPCNGSLYDDFRFCDIESGDVIYTIIPSSGHSSKKGQAEIWGRENGFEGPLFEGSWKEAKNWFMDPDSKYDSNFEIEITNPINKLNEKFQNLLMGLYEEGRLEGLAELDEQGNLVLLEVKDD
jgi:hypothetical protein